LSTPQREHPGISNGSRGLNCFSFDFPLLIAVWELNKAIYFFFFFVIDDLVPWNDGCVISMHTNHFQNPFFHVDASLSSTHLYWLINWLLLFGMGFKCCGVSYIAFTKLIFLVKCCVSGTNCYSCILAVHILYCYWWENKGLAIWQYGI